MRQKPENNHFQMHTDSGTFLNNDCTDNWLLHHSTDSSCISVSAAHNAYTT